MIPQNVINAVGIIAAKKNGNVKGSPVIGGIPIKYKNKSKFPITLCLLNLGELNFKYDTKILDILSMFIGSHSKVTLN